MNTIEEITEVILSRSKFKEDHLKKFSNDVLLEKIAGKADLESPETKKAAKFVLVLINELRARCEFINPDVSAKYWNEEQTYNYASVDNTTYGHTKIFSKFLNTYDVTGESFKPLLERLKIIQMKFYLRQSLKRYKRCISRGAIFIVTLIAI